jgi:hypothetical protein
MMSGIGIVEMGRRCKFVNWGEIDVVENFWDWVGKGGVVGRVLGHVMRR